MGQTHLIEQGDESGVRPEHPLYEHHDDPAPRGAEASDPTGHPGGPRPRRPCLRPVLRHPRGPHGDDDGLHDDAYVNAHVTFVAPRIVETVVSVHVDDNDHVRKGDLLVVPDRDVEQGRSSRPRPL